jgi:hypothetical protein
MPREITPGRGMEAFFAPSEKPKNIQTEAPPEPTVRTTLTLKQQDADRLELIRLHLRRTQGRGMTYGDVVAMALQSLAEKESLPMALSPPGG